MGKGVGYVWMFIELLRSPGSILGGSGCWSVSWDENQLLKLLNGIYIKIESNGVVCDTSLDIFNEWFIHIFGDVRCNPLSNCQLWSLEHQPQEATNYKREILVWVVEIKESGNLWAVVGILTLVTARHHLPCASKVFGLLL